MKFNFCLETAPRSKRVRSGIDSDHRLKAVASRQRPNEWLQGRRRRRGGGGHTAQQFQCNGEKESPPFSMQPNHPTTDRASLTRVPNRAAWLPPFLKHFSLLLFLNKIFIHRVVTTFQEAGICSQWNERESRWLVLVQREREIHAGWFLNPQHAR